MEPPENEPNKEAKEMNVVIIAVLAAIFIGELIWLARWPEG